jgi:hypothetical protein
MKNEAETTQQIELYEYKIKSDFYEPNEEDDTKSIELYLPTPESFEKLQNIQIVKEFVNFNLSKYKSFFIEQKEEKSSEEKIILNLNKNSFIKSKEILPFLTVFLGGINSINSIYELFGEIGTENQAREEIFFDKCENYLQYINSFVDFVKENEKLNIPFSQMEQLFNSLDELGINIPREDKNVLYRNIKDSFFLMGKNKILVIMAPSNNFWIKSEKNSINDQNYDIKLNNYSNIFYHKKFIQKFLSKITKHPRCSFGLISSMTYKNLKNCWEALERQFSPVCPKKVVFFAQKEHDQIMFDPKKKKIRFFRSIDKIIQHLKKEKEKDLKEKCRNKTDDVNENNENVEYFNRKNIIILESEEDKSSENTKCNSLFLNVFNEHYLESNEKERMVDDLEADKAINYILNLLENCTDDVRGFLSNNKISNKSSSMK